MEDKITQLRGLLARVSDLSAAANILEWDQETYMPPGAAEARAEQIATLRRLAHEFMTADEVGVLLEDAGAQLDGADPLTTGASLVRVARRDYDKATKVPASLVAEMAAAIARGKQAWKQAREANTFETFAPHLEKLVDLNIRKAEALGYEDRIYDALLDQYEPDMKTAEVERVFKNLRAELVPIVQALAAQPAPDDNFLHRHFDRQKQWDFTLAVIRDLGYSFEHGRQDVSAHPFTTTFAITDVRLTTRLHEHFFPTGLFGSMHEAGHGMYEQGIDSDLARTPLAEGTSLGMHESQSRMWENQVGRSRAFWQHYYPRLQQVFPDALGGVSPDAFYRALNKVEPSLIRVEADEVTYNLHIMLRFELENAMVDGRVAIRDLPELWNSKMEEYLGLRPDSDANGVLQDIHWSLGTLGYFPTYSLGNLMSAQLFDQACRDLPDLEDQITGGTFAGLLGWLREHVHCWGRKLTATEILERTTGEGLQARSWLAYIRGKYGEVYPGAL
ncbi:MAG TPA: carboxypeptidase M32 [Rhodothermales bacterium]|nr:carboxypeptidase M32 [Rhodothermales bacterium]